MIFVREASAAVVLVTLTLLLQCAGMAALISWGRTSLAPEVHRLGPILTVVLMMRFITACPAHIRDSALGGLLSLALFSIVGVRVLLLSC